MTPKLSRVDGKGKEEKKSADWLEAKRTERP
jgi:hypothetical protein